MSVKVAVRVRPFNQREKELESQLCVDMVGQKTVLLDLEDPKKNRDFTFDYSFWSHDEFENDENGLSIGTSTRYADQQRVFDTVGQEILTNAWEGYHCCLFAYGQTGAGKSYSMVGYGANKGIVPISCDEIFKRIQSNPDSSKQYEVQVSMLEIYNEKVQDLLIPCSKRPAGGLKVREHKLYGVYVEGLTKHPVDSYEAIEAKMDDGNRHRTVAATQMNATSSRAHTIIQIEFKQIIQGADRKSEKLSVINLVDLAGSEKVGKTGAQGDRLKEASNINKSLTVLGQVIAALAEKSMGKGKNHVVPYRDSQLTRILQNALGGNSKTLMICAISPATDNYEETLSTLRYADQAKKIKNNATINESDTDKKIREQQEEITTLKRQLQMLMQQMQGGGQISMQLLEQMNQIKDNIEVEEHFMEENQQTFEEKLHQQKQKDNESDDDIHQSQEILLHPHLINLNEDPLLDRKIRKTLKNEITQVGKANGDPEPDIIISGLGISANHATFTNVDGVITLEPYKQECSEFIQINGENCTKKTILQHNDRIIFRTTTFLLQIPNEGQLQQGNYDWEYAQREITEKAQEKRRIEQEIAEKALLEEMEKKKKILEEERRKEKEESELKMQQYQKDYENKLLQLEQQRKSEVEQQRLLVEKAEAERKHMEEMQRVQNEKATKEAQREKVKKQYEDEETMKKYRIKEKNFIENKLSKYLPKVLEVNLIAKELKRNVQLEAKLKYIYAENNDFQTFNEENAQKGQIQIQVNNREEGQIYLWDLHKFSNRYYIIKDLLDKYFETNTIPQMIKEEDPFWDPPEPRIIGQGFLKIQALAYLMDNPSDLTLVGEHFQSGTLSVNLIPTDDSGQRNLSEDIEDGLEPPVEDPNELLNKRFDFRIVISGGKLPENLCKDTFVEYQVQVSDKKQTQKYRTKTLQGAHPTPQYNYDQLHTYDCLSEDLLNYLINGTICFKVYGFEDTKKEKNQARQRPVEEAIEHSGKPKQQPVQVPTPQLTPSQQEHINNLQKTTQQQQQQQQLQKPAIVDTRGPGRAREYEDVKPETQQFQSKLNQQNLQQKPRSQSSEKVIVMQKKEEKKKDKDCSIF